MSERGSVPPLPTFENEDPLNTFRILLVTDTHVGYAERDPIRGGDSLRTLREVLQLAVKHDVDMVLMAGDIFHDNRPSRDTLHQTIALLREFTLGDKPVSLELMSDEMEGCAPGFSFPAVNYADPNLNVSIPVFSIHGNHDDPQGSGPAGALCALDLLSVSGMFNYMGKIDLPSDNTNPETHNPSNAGISIKPVLLRKGHTKLALYGVGNVKDARMHYELRSGRVRMYMPTDASREWFNVLLVHQNRVPHPPNPSIPEGLFSDSIDLVVWGHEHDCRITPEPVAGKPYFITQPGSTIATSLSVGESIEKNVGLVQIRGKEYTIRPIPLRTVRPFVTDSIVLSEAAEEDNIDINDALKLKQYLATKVNELIKKAEREWKERQQEAVDDDDDDEIKIDVEETMLPLVRLRVDTTGTAPSFNPIRFSLEFAGRVANPRDVLVFHRAPRRAQRTEPITAPDSGLVGELEDPDISIAEKLQRVRVGTLVKEYLGAQELQLLGEDGLSEAISSFVEKDDSHSIESYVNSSLKVLLRGAQARPDDTIGDENGEEGESDLDQAIQRARENQTQAYEEHQQKKATQRPKVKGKETLQDDAASVDSMELDENFDLDNAKALNEDDSDAPVSKKKKTAATTKKVAAPRTTAKKVASSAAKKKATTVKGSTKSKSKAVASDEDSGENFDLDQISDASSEVAETAKPTAKKGRAALLSSIGTQKTTAKTTKKGGTQLSFVPSQSSGARGSTRKAAAAARGKTSMYVDDSSDE